MDMNMLTQKTIEALKNAEQIALDHNHMEIEPDHLMLSLLSQEGGIVARLIEKLGKTTYPMIEELKNDIEKKPSVSGPGREPGITEFTEKTT